jgi:phosphoribosylanthranilate isomerase
MTWVKICGMTNLEDALAAADAGVDALGFVFYGKSPRNIGVDLAREIVSRVPERIEKVGVFVDTPVSQVDETLWRVGLTTAQVYSKSFDEWLAWSESSDRKLILAIPGSTLKKGLAGSLGVARKRITAFLVDSGSGDIPGGTGDRFNWESAKLGIWNLGLTVPVVVAGGLTAENVDEAIKTLRPWGVDVASGVESRPGKKDPAKVRAFVHAVRERDRKTS